MPDTPSSPLPIESLRRLKRNMDARTFQPFDGNDLDVALVELLARRKMDPLVAQVLRAVIDRRPLDVAGARELLKELEALGA